MRPIDGSAGLLWSRAFHQSSTLVFIGSCASDLEVALHINGGDLGGLCEVNVFGGHGPVKDGHGRRLTLAAFLDVVEEKGSRGSVPRRDETYESD